MNYVSKVECQYQLIKMIVWMVNNGSCLVHLVATIRTWPLWTVTHKSLLIMFVVHLTHRLCKSCWCCCQEWLDDATSLMSMQPLTAGYATNCSYNAKSLSLLQPLCHIGQSFNFIYYICCCIYLYTSWTCRHVHVHRYKHLVANFEVW